MTRINDYILERGLPHSQEHESAVLGALLMDKTVLELLTEANINEDYFYSPTLCSVYIACKELVDQDKEIDILSVKANLKLKHSSENVFNTLLRLSDIGSEIFLRHIPTHIDGLMLYHNKRKAIHDGVELIEKGYNGRFLEDFITGKTLIDDVRNYIVNSTGEFNVIDIDRELGLMSKQQKNNRRKIMHKLTQEAVIERIGKRTGTYRLIVKDENIIDWQAASLDDVYKLKLVFGIDSLVNIFPKNIIIIAGEKDAGKTALLLNVVKDNMFEHQVFYFSSEMVEMELKTRLSKFEDVTEWKFTAIERSGNFQDIIRPDDLNIIDFLEISDNFFRIAEDIRRIYDKLNKGIAIIAIQKKAGTDFGRGAEFSMEKARLYLSLQSGTNQQPSQLKIVSAKNWTDEHVNPRGKIYDYKLRQGCEFIQTNLITNPYEYDKRYKE